MTPNRPLKQIQANRCVQDYTTCGPHKHEVQRSQSTRIVTHYTAINPSQLGVLVRPSQSWYS